MDKDYAEIECIFSQAADLRDAAERVAFLNTACGQDQLLRAAVERLLKHDVADSFLEPPPTGDMPPIEQPPVDQPPVEQPGTMIGPYKLIEEIGHGGMGNVFMALQKTPVRRKVALKLIKPGMDSKQVVSRFEAERQALALMDHPSIARVFDGGTTESGRPYFVMELVRGTPDHRLLRQAQTHDQRAARSIRRRLPGHPTRSPERRHPPRPEAVEHHGHAL